MSEWFKGGVAEKLGIEAFMATSQHSIPMLCAVLIIVSQEM